MLFNVNKQIITRTDSDKIVSNSIDYLTATFTFSADHSGMTKTAIFSNGTIDFEIVLDQNNSITKDDHLNLSQGIWVVSTVSVGNGTTIRTDMVPILVLESGGENGMIPPEPTLSVYEQIMNAFSEASQLFQTKELLVKLYGTKSGTLTVNLTDTTPTVSATNYIETAATSNVTIDFVNGTNITFSRTSLAPIKLKKHDLVEFNIFTAFNRDCSVEYGSISYINGVQVASAQTFGNQDFKGVAGFTTVQVLKYIMDLDLLEDEPVAYPAGTVFTTKLFKRQESATPTLTTHYLFGVNQNGLDRFSYATIKTNI